MPQQYRETTITVFGKTQVIRTERKTTITALETAHTRAVRAALTEAYAAVPEAEKQLLKKALEWRANRLEHEATSGMPLTPEWHSTWAEIHDLRALAEVVGKHKFTPAKSCYVDPKPVPVRYTDKIPESVQPYHEYVQDALV